MHHSRVTIKYAYLLLYACCIPTVPSIRSFIRAMRVCTTYYKFKDVADYEKDVRAQARVRIVHRRKRRTRVRPGVKAREKKETGETEHVPSWRYAPGWYACTCVCTYQCIHTPYTYIHTHIHLRTSYTHTHLHIVISCDDTALVRQCRNT